MPDSNQRSIKRPRPTFNCLVCRDRKVRCGRERPECANCKKSGRECVYQPASVPATEARNHPRTRKFSGTLFGPSSILDASVGDNEESLLPPHIDFLAQASVLKSLPDKGICDALVEVFFDSIYSIYPMIDRQDFQRWYADFWKWCSEKTQSAIIPPTLLEDITGNCVLVAVLFAGASAAPESIWEQPYLARNDKEALMNDFRSSLVKSLSACDHLEHPTTSTIIAELIADPFMGRQLDSPSNGLFVSRISCLAQRLGLHQHVTASNLKAWQHKHIWQHIVWLDVQYSVSTGLPLSSGVASPNGSTSPASSAAELGGEGFISRLLLVRSEVVGLEQSFLSHMQGAHFISEFRYAEYLTQARDISDKIRSTIEAIPEYRSGEEEAVDNLPSAFRQWAQSILTMSRLEPFIILQTLTLDANADQGPEIEAEWSRASELSVQYLSIYIILATDPEYHPYRWYLDRCAMPTHCTLLLVTYLRRYPQAPDTRACEACLRAAFDRWDRDIANGGKVLTSAQARLKRLFEVSG
ncbi:hypothetical protein BJY04DRAFT_221809 [Aspergillus karnatakaensis]|uniref:uncharacterized protein n=1 Tax=Aspergillus karnatakaensis TaxID=1810916 RepID=UPI003CCD8EC7